MAIYNFQIIEKYQSRELKSIDVYVHFYVCIYININSISRGVMKAKINRYES